MSPIEQRGTYSNSTCFEYNNLGGYMIRGIENLEENRWLAVESRVLEDKDLYFKIYILILFSTGISQLG